MEKQDLKTKKRIITIENIQHLKIIALIGLVINTVILSLNLKIPQYELLKDLDAIYRLLWMLASVIYIVIVGKPKKADDLSFKQQVIFMSASALSLVFSALLTAVAFKTKGITYLFIVNTLLTCTFLSLSAVEYLSVIIPSLIILHLSVEGSFQNSLDYRSNLINILSVVLFSIVISHINFRAKFKQLESISIIEQKNNALQVLSELDDLTGIPNRRRIHTILDDVWQISTRENLDFSILMIDVDFFKKYNDAYGHIAGDQCLKQVALTLTQSSQRKTDYIGRYGGEEFIAILSGTDETGAYQIAETMRHAVEHQNIVHESTELKSVTISIGIAHQRPHRFSTIEKLIHAADDALYQAKHQGRNQTVIYSDNK